MEHVLAIFAKGGFLRDIDSDGDQVESFGKDFFCGEIVAFDVPFDKRTEEAPTHNMEVDSLHGLFVFFDGFGDIR